MTVNSIGALKKPNHTYKQWIVAIIASSPLFTYGLQTGWMSPTIKLLRSPDNPEGYAFSESTIWWIASAFFMAAIFSTPFYSFIADKYGRKFAIFAIIVSQLLVWIIKLTSAHPISLIIARVMAGIGGGGVFNAVPIYLKEISEDSIRGAVSTTVMLFQSIGVMVMYALGSYTDYYTVLRIVIAVPVVNGLLLVMVPESPSYLVKKGKIEEARKIVAFLRNVNENNKIVCDEVTKMQKEEQRYSSLPMISMKDILSNPTWRKGVIITATLMTLLDASGNMAITTYAASIVSASSVTISPELRTLSIPIVMILGSFVSMFSIEKCGRKPLMITSLILTGLAMSTLAAVLLVQEHGGWMPGWLPIIALITSVFFYGVGLLPIPYLVISEMFNFQMRAKIMGYIVTYGWFLCFLQVYTFGYMSEALGMYAMFFVFSGVNFFGAVICCIFLPETKGKSVDEIENALNGVNIKKSTENV